MTRFKETCNFFCGHRVIIMMVLCLFVLGLYGSSVRKKRRTVKDERVHLIHADELRYDMYGPNPDAQIVTGKVHFRNGTAHLWCDSAYFYQESNSVKAYGHVRFNEGDTLTLTCVNASYDGVAQMLEARKNVVLKHHRQTLYTDSLNFDRLYSNAYFFEGGRLVDGKDRLISDWGQYNTETRQAAFYYNVSLSNGQRLITTDTLYYDTKKSLAHVVGPSKITQKGSVVTTDNGYFDTNTDFARMYGRSTVVDKQKTITGDSLYYDSKTGLSEGYGNVVYVDKENKNQLTCGKLIYNEKTGYGFATLRPVAVDYSQKDTLWMHSDSMKVYTFNINTDSVYRKVHCFPHVRAYRVDVQAVCDSMVANSQDSCLYMYKDPIVWNSGRQLLGEVIQVYMNDSTVREAQVHGQSLSVELMPDGEHYNQLASQDLYAYFLDGDIRRTDAVKNVRSIYYPVDDKDSSLIGLNYLETDTMRMFMGPDRKLERIWTPKAEGTLYPMGQIPPSKKFLDNFAWFDYVRPKDKDDIYEWRGKARGQELKTVKRHDAPLQHL